MTRRTPVGGRLVARVVPLVVLAILAACGGDSSGSSSGSMSDEDFCREVERLNSTDPGSDVDAALGILSGLADKAPNDEVREALQAIGPVIEEMSNIDESDPEAMARAFELMFSPELVKAGEVLNAYSSEVCGFESSTTDPVLEPVDPSGDSTGIDADLISTATEELVSGMGLTATLASTAVQATSEGTLVQVDFIDVENFDALAICNALRLFVDGVGNGANVEVEVSIDGSVAARKDTGQACVEA